MIASRCQKCNQIGTCMCNFKTVHENQVQTNPFSIENQVYFQIQELKRKIKNLSRYESNTNSGGQDCWCTMDEDKEGEWVKLEDVLSLFSAKKE